MNIKSLLLGSAAALVAVTGARAADVIVPVEPEPVEYVRVCDIYGTGFYYIPGTETCLQISGYVRFEARYESEGNAVTIDENGDVDFQANLDGDDELWYTRTRGRLNFDARQETDLGTLRAYYRLQATYQDIDDFQDNGSLSGDADVEMDRGFLQIGGLTAGYLETLWVSELGGGDLTSYAGTGLDAEYLPYGDRQVNQINYTFEANGFAASLGLESDGTGDFAPDVVGKLAYAGGFGAAWLIGAFDERRTEENLFPFIDDVDDFLDDDSDGGFSLKAGIALQDLLVADSLLKVQGHYSFDPTAFSYAPNPGANVEFLNPNSSRADNAGVPLEYTIEAGYTQSFGQIDAGLGGIFGQSFEFFGEDADYYGLEGNLVYNFTDQFFAGLFLTYEELDFDGPALAGTPFVSEDEEFRGFLRIQRSF